MNPFDFITLQLKSDCTDSWDPNTLKDAFIDGNGLEMGQFRGRICSVRDRDDAHTGAGKTIGSKSA
jgi:hypothetical protein